MTQLPLGLCDAFWADPTPTAALPEATPTPRQALLSQIRDAKAQQAPPSIETGLAKDAQALSEGMGSAARLHSALQHAHGRGGLLRFFCLAQLHDVADAMDRVAALFEAECRGPGIPPLSHRCRLCGKVRGDGEH